MSIEKEKLVCKKCFLEKEIKNFTNNSKYKSGKHPYCKSCNNTIVENYRKTKKGLCFYIYHLQCRHSKKRGHSLPKYTKEELKEWIFSQDNFNSLYDSWKKSEYNKDLKPSIDRIDDYKGYSFDNIRLMTWKQNNINSHNATKHGINNKRNKAVRQKSLEGITIKDFPSQNIASRDTGVNQSDISSVCRGKRKTAGGFKWEYILVVLFLFSSKIVMPQSITEIQKNRIKDIFTPEKIIDISKGLSNEKNQDSIIKLRDSQIKELELKVKSLSEEHLKTLQEIAKQNSIAIETTNQVDSISQKQLKKERFKWKGLHLYIGAEVPEISVNNTIINSELMYEFSKIEFGLKGEVNSVSGNSNFNYLLKLRYKIF